MIKFTSYLILLYSFNQSEEKWIPIEHEEDMEDHYFEKFQTQYLKLQGDIEMVEKRKEVFIDNHKQMAKRNQEAMENGETLRLGVNEYADMSFDEFMKGKGGLFEITQSHLESVPSTQFETSHHDELRERVQNNVKSQQMKDILLGKHLETNNINNYRLYDTSTKNDLNPKPNTKDDAKKKQEEEKKQREDEAHRAEVEKELKKYPDEVDWRKDGMVLNPVRNQGGCGSCWAFSTVHVLESRQAVHAKKLMAFSEQELIDCDDTSYGCNGGWPMNAFSWVKSHGPVLRDGCPQMGDQTNKCCQQPKKLSTGLQGFNVQDSKLLKSGDDLGLVIALQGGSVSTAVAVNRDFQMQSHGVLDIKACPSKQVNHAVNTVGQTPDQWIVRNSWGKEWGVGGQVYVSRKGNTCSLLDYNSYAIF